jgi:microcystin degradation protein MlrC
MARRKIVVAMMMHETNTFSPVPTPLASFRPLSGQAAIEEFRDTNTQLGGFLHVAEEAKAEIVVPLAAGAHPSGYVEKAAYEDMSEAIVGAIRNGCDAIFLALHGAMVAEHLDDGEGELLRRIRAVAGWRRAMNTGGPALPSLQREISQGKIERPGLEEK